MQSQHTDSLDEVSAVFRNAAAMPNTPAARQSLANLIRTSKVVGYSQIARATGHDTSWVCRFLQNEARMNAAELLAWLDVGRLRIATESDTAEAKHMLSELAEGLKREQGLVRQAQAGVTLDTETYAALVTMARRGAEAMAASAGE